MTTLFCQPRIAPLALGADAAEPLLLGARCDSGEAPRDQPGGCSLHERVIALTEGLSGFDWVI